MVATIKDVAQQAGVSIATVSRALNTPDRVSLAAQSAVQAAIAALGFRPNLIGRQLRADKTGLIGVMLPTLSNPVFAECLQGIEQAALAANYRVLLMTTHYRADREQHALETLLNQRVDGMILTVAHAAQHAWLDRLEDLSVPYMLVYNQCDARPCVSVDNRAAAAQGVTELLLRGHRHIAMISGQLQASDRAQQRYQGYCDAMRAAGLVPGEPLEIDFESADLPPELVGRLTGPDRPTAVFCGNDRLAILVMRRLLARGLRIPQDVAILGFDGLEIGELLAPALATVSQPNADIGARAMERLHGWLDSGQRLASLVLPHGIRRGGSIHA
ncbi:LacI family DNA-binding transcriptional regulator [Andreprevotia chitinilytica]|uniref:LacI family DNA-binding transcriptional regulator n=1 Tax=Andreprevotia chitinilytica TaxID=396808 RepID=UPI00054FEC73|nr:LacI family DNA-binding transcriptional regulator [Andreprevotia chitinilytica]